ncbi:RNA polymerase sigma-I factor [Clostridium aciditolerans]|uniref:RNA polymerase sigma factor SigI n=1 Tax=Clostridium aciditolerans TaxID=339861 RepID=A0A934I079_9CLOT|nr:RNA polymerase sigma-I factor [Clostridium aciditolerans]MBI6873640.1 RNA polymerase sigma-I factor [Clostridium aciditolerans]
MFFFKRSLEERVEKAKKDKEELNKLIEIYKPFIASTIQKKTGRFLQYGYDDELTIGMMAFKEAVDSYDKNKGKFLNFAKMVINLRCIDYYRKNEKYKEMIYLQGLYESENEVACSQIENKAIEEYKNQEENKMRKLEIQEYEKELKKWGIEFLELVQASPKQEKLKNLYKEVAQFIVRESDVLDNLVSTKRLPIKEIQQNIPIHRKKIERGRIYIIALVIVLIGDYKFIREYIE